MSAIFESDSEYKWVTSDTDSTFIQFKSDNPGKTSTWQNGMIVEVIKVTKRLRTVEKSSVSSGTKREGRISKRTESLDDLLLSAVDETLRQVFREEGIKVIYNYFENNSHLKREEIAEKPDVFSAGLERLLGSGAPVIEILILKNLYRKLGLKSEEKKGYEFSDYIKELRKRCGY